MTIPATVELAGELRRLACAGVALAKGDRRIAALVPVLEASGAKAPVFADIAARAAALIDAPKSRAAADFLALNTLVGAVLKTQGGTAIDGELVPPPPSCTAPKPLTVRALDALGEGVDGGRMEALHDALDRGLFGDARLARFALDAIRSDNAEIANLAAARMLPAYGPGIVPQLTAALDLTEKRVAARTIEAIRGADPDAAAQLARAILDPGVDEALGVRTGGIELSEEGTVAALGSLADTEPDRAILREHLKAKRRALRVAALGRLLGFGDEVAVAHAAAMFGGSATKVREAAETVPSTAPAAVVDAAAEGARRLSDELAGADRSELKDAEAGAVVALLALLVSSARTDRRFDALVRLCAHVPSLARGRHDFDHELRGTLAEYLIGHCPDGRHAELTSLLLDWEPGMAATGLIRRLGPDRALELLEGAGHDRFAQSLQGANAVCAEQGRVFAGTPCPPASEWNKRWQALAGKHALHRLAWHLRTIAPTRLVDDLLTPKSIEPGTATLALALDPGCAARVAERLQGAKSVTKRLREICLALSEGDRAAALALMRRTREDGPYIPNFERLCEAFPDLPDG